MDTTSTISKIQVPKLKGSENYILWAIRAKAYLSNIGYYLPIDNNDIDIFNTPDIDRKALYTLQLLVEDGPLLQIQYSTTTIEAWDILKDLYNPTGFSSDFSIIREFLSTTLLSEGNNIELYLNKIKRLYNSLKERNIEFPRQVIIAILLYNLTEEYEGFISSTIYNLRSISDFSDYKLESLFSSLIDESKRLVEKESTTVLYLKNKKPYYNNNRVNKKPYKGKKPWKIQKGLYCKYCKLVGHEADSCYFLHPDKAPKTWKNTTITTTNSSNKTPREENPSLLQRNQNIDLLFTTSNTSNTTTSNTTNSDIEDLIDLDYEQPEIQVYITNNPYNINSIKTITNKNIGLNSTSFILDTGATRHVICNKELFNYYTDFITTVNWGEAGSLSTTGSGNVIIQFIDTKKLYYLQNCLYIPNLGINIISQGQLVNKATFIDTNNITILNKPDYSILTRGYKKNNLYYLPIEVTFKNPIYKSPIYITNLDTTTKKEVVWHNRYGHTSYKIIKLLENTTIGYNNSNNYTNIPTISRPIPCEVCIQAKLQNQVNRISKDISNLVYLDKITSDIVGPISPIDKRGNKYIITFLDKKTRYLEIELLKSKAESLNAFKRFKARSENNPEYSIKILKTDNGTEYTNKGFSTLLDSSGIIHEYSPVYTKEPNGLAERINLTIFNKIRALLYNSRLPKAFWGDAALYSIYLYNRTPHSSINYITPYEAKNNEKPTISNITTFGSICFYKNKGPKVEKLDPRGIKGIVLGVNDNIYKIYNPTTNKYLFSRDIIILENQFHTLTGIQDKSLIELPLTIPLDTRMPSISSTIDNSSRSTTIDPITTNNSIVNTTSNNNTITREYHPISTDNTLDELSIFYTYTINKEPNTYKEAINSIDKTEWLKAMDIEVKELENQNTYTILEKSSIQANNILKGRWVYKIKTDKDNNIIKYKARWVVKGYNQVIGIDYLDTFSTTCRPENYRIIFILAVYYNWPLKQYDVKNAFPHATIDMDIYIYLPIGFYTDNKIGKLNKALYGLKQSPRLWYRYLRSILEKYGFTILPTDEGIFINYNPLTILVCHVDDIIATGIDITYINNLINKIQKDIKIQPLGDITTFLGINFEVDYTTKTISLSQNNYIDKILNKYNKVNLIPSKTPIDIGVKLEKNLDKALDIDITAYQQEIGAILYLAIKTRADIAYTINRLARFMANPSKTHFKALDKLWKYILGTRTYKQYYNCNTIPNLIGYSDADWGGDLVNRYSTTGYIFYYGINNPISWFSGLQKTVAISTCEAEYIALKEAIKEAIYLNNSIKEITKASKLPNSTTIEDIPPILVDSQSAIKLAENPEFHKRTKHIDISYHFIREAINNKITKVLYIPTKEQKANGFTKPLDNIRQKEFLEVLNIY